MYIQDANRVKPELEEQFCSKLTVCQLWVLVKLMRTARRSCRSNQAFYSFLKLVFPYADFRDVKKDNKWGKGLQISVDAEKYSGGDNDNGDEE
jgi:hypothetical protein